MHLFHFFVPHIKNNHRAKLLHNVTLLVLVLSILFATSGAVYLQKVHPQVLGVRYEISDAELLNLVNFERSQNGLPPLSLNPQLRTAAQKKSQHMFLHNYWAHFAPDGTSPWELIRNEGYDYTHAGENLAKGFTTSYDTVKAWMNSPTHRANILSDKYTEVGFSIDEGRLLGEDTVLIVQEFGDRDGIAVAPPQNTSRDLAIKEVQGSSLLSEANVSTRPLIDITVMAKTVTFLLLSALLIALILDFVIIEKKKIPRIVGNNLDHMIIITIFVVFILMTKLGEVI